MEKWFSVCFLAPRIITSTIELREYRSTMDAPLYHVGDQVWVKNGTSGEHEELATILDLPNRTRVPDRIRIKYFASGDEVLVEYDKVQSLISKRRQELFRRIEQNDDTLKLVWIGNVDGALYNVKDFGRFGASVAGNTNIKRLGIDLCEIPSFFEVDRDFFEGLKSNTSIRELSINCGTNNIMRGLGVTGRGILNVYQENNNNLTCLEVRYCDLDMGVEHIIAATLRRCTNLKKIKLTDTNISYEQLLAIVEAVRGHHSLEQLLLYGNRIGNAGCEAIATLLEDPNSNLRILNLGSNAIDNDGAIALTNSLVNNTKLKALYLYSNPIDQGTGDAFARILCNKSSIKQTYISNHTLQELCLPRLAGDQVASLVNMNKKTSKSHIAMRKILKYHPNIDMEPLFDWDLEGERSLKALPYVVAWYDRAVEVDEKYREGFCVKEQKLSAMYQFARAMPLLFVPTSHIKGNEKKRKIYDMCK